MTIIAIIYLFAAMIYCGWRVQWHADDPGVAHDFEYPDCYPSVGSEVRE